MKTIKMSLENIQEKLSRKEMKKIIAGVGEYQGQTNGSCTDGFGNSGTLTWQTWTTPPGYICVH